MCGIAGFFAYDPARASSPALAADILTAMTDVITHRGPDDSGQFVDGPVALGMRRLAIIDLNTGHQPLFNEDRSLALVCNGEIYNFRELRAALAERGHRFTTCGDMEPLVHLYEDVGTQLPTHLRGMFAFALWDSTRKRLLLARDRLGVKPLYFADTHWTLVFGS